MEKSTVSIANTGQSCYSLAFIPNFQRKNLLTKSSLSHTKILTEKVTTCPKRLLSFHTKFLTEISTVVEVVAP